MDWSSPHFSQVLLSANHGLITWSPAMVFAILGWMLLLRSWRSFACGSFAVLLATTWINGGVAVWWGGAAFGARRFDLVIPLLAGGMAAAIAFAVRLVQHRPIIVPAAVLGILFLWNVGLMRFSRSGVFMGAAPLEEVAQRQALLVRRIAEEWLERIGGPRARSLAYMIFVGRYFYVDIQFDGLVDVRAHDCPYLSGGWSESEQRRGWGSFRWAFEPRACVRIPLERPFEMRVDVTARVPNVVEGQMMTLYANRKPVGMRAVTNEWQDLRFVVPTENLNPGENLLCLGFSQHMSDSRAAAIKRIKLP
jgi:hypothetical protein